MRPSELGLPAGNARSNKGGGKGAAGKESGGPTVVLSPEELEKLVERQQQGETPADVLRDLRDSDEDDEDLYGPPSPHAEEESALWEDVANAVLWTIPFGFLFCGMYARSDSEAAFSTLRTDPATLATTRQGLCRAQAVWRMALARARVLAAPEFLARSV